jgi:hypothetical protein
MTLTTRRIMSRVRGRDCAVFRVSLDLFFSYQLIFSFSCALKVVVVVVFLS